MEKIEKFLNKRTWKERKFIGRIIALIINNRLANLDIKKIRGFKSLYRVRIKNFRIIFKIKEDRNSIIDIRERDDRTYKNLND